MAQEAQHCASPCQLFHGHRLAADVQHLQLRPAGPCTHSTQASVHDMQGTLDGILQSCGSLVKRIVQEERFLPLRRAACLNASCCWAWDAGPCSCRPTQPRAEARVCNHRQYFGRPPACYGSTTFLWCHELCGISLAVCQTLHRHPAVYIHHSPKLSCSSHAGPLIFQGDHAFERKYAACSNPWWCRAGLAPGQPPLKTVFKWFSHTAISSTQKCCTAVAYCPAGLLLASQC